MRYPAASFQPSVLRPEEKLKMPNFRFTETELDKVVTAVLGFQKLNASSAAKKELNAEETSAWTTPG